MEFLLGYLILLSSFKHMGSVAEWLWRPVVVAWPAQTNDPFYNGFYGRDYVGYTLIIYPLLLWKGSCPWG